MSDRARVWRWSSALLGLVVLFMVAFVPIPFVARSPGPVFDVLGEHDGKPVVEITGTRQYPTDGAMFMTTVAERGGANSPMTVVSAVVGLVSPTTTVLPDDATESDVAFQQAVFDASGSQALGAAASYLGRPVEEQPVIISTTPGTAAEGVFQAGDLVASVDGRDVTTAEQMGRILRAEPVGTEFDIVVTRGDQTIDQTVATGPSPQDPAVPVIGVNLGDHFSSDFKATVTLTSIGGPSAGLMLALAMVDKLTPGNLLDGRDVAGTGAIDGAGRVGPIGGVDKKMIAAQQAGAQLFLTPEGNCGEIAGNVPDGLDVAPVTTLSESVGIIEQWRAGQPLPACPVASEQQQNG